jgi:hypothetical protein
VGSAAAAPRRSVGLATRSLPAEGTRHPGRRAAAIGTSDHSGTAPASWVPALSFAQAGMTGRCQVDTHRTAKRRQNQDQRDNADGDQEGDGLACLGSRRAKARQHVVEFERVFGRLSKRCRAAPYRAPHTTATALARYSSGLLPFHVADNRRWPHVRPRVGRNEGADGCGSLRLALIQIRGALLGTLILRYQI